MILPLLVVVSVGFRIGIATRMKGGYQFEYLYLFFKALNDIYFNTTYWNMFHNLCTYYG